MSLLDKQEVQDICGHTALRTRKWSGFICKRAPEDTYCARSKSRFFLFARCVHKIPMLYTRSIGNQPWNTMVVFKMRDSVPSASYSSVCNVLRQWSISLIPILKERKNFFFNEQKVGMLCKKRTNTRGVGISSMRKSIYRLTTTPIDSTHSH